jgi:hypothetical protein
VVELVSVVEVPVELVVGIVAVVEVPVVPVVGIVLDEVLVLLVVPVVPEFSLCLSVVESFHSYVVFVELVEFGGDFPPEDLPGFCLYFSSF